MSHLQIVWLGNLKTECLHPGGERILTDAPKEIGGEGSAFSPTDLFALSLGTCLLTVMGLEARRLDVDLTGSRVEVDKEMSTNSPRRIARLLVRFYGPLMASESNRKSLEQAALDCPVHHSLNSEIRKRFDFFWGEERAHN